MLISNGKERGRCSRRAFLRGTALGLGTLGCGGLSLVDVLRGDAHAAGPRAAKSLIYVVLSGGPSHIDMYDLKPEAPAEFRGPFRPIATSLVGAHICEHMPLQAKLMHRCTLVRGIRSVENDHFLSEVYTGLPRTAGKRPAFGSLVSRLSSPATSLPTYVSVGRRPSPEFDYELPNYAGAAHAPFRPYEESLDDLTPVAELDRLQRRRELLKAFDTMARVADQATNYATLDRFQAQALQIITSPAVRDAFDLSKEPAGMLDRYGHNQGGFTHQTVKTLRYPWDAKPFLMARRLIEAGARVVTLQVGNWDHHGTPTTDIFYSLAQMLPSLDRTLHALLSDLAERGLDHDTAVVVLGEFGRTPKITSPGPGREHWADAGCALFYGGSLKMGQVIGATDPRAERSIDGKIGFQNIMATIYRHLGVDPGSSIADFNGRPQYLLDDCEPVAQLVA